MVVGDKLNESTAVTATRSATRNAARGHFRCNIAGLALWLANSAETWRQPNSPLQPYPCPRQAFFIRQLAGASQPPSPIRGEAIPVPPCDWDRAGT